MRSKNKKYIGIELSPELYNTIKQISLEKEISISALIRMIIIDYFKNDKR